MAFSRSQITILITICVASILCFMSLSIMAPFFPEKAEDRGISSALSGWIFGIFSLVQFLSAPILGRLIPRMGSRFLLLAGSFLGGGCTILFGVLDKFPQYDDNNTTFVIFCFLLRISWALGCTAINVATYSIAANEFTDATSTAMGCIETANGIGLMLGPATGGLLSKVGGFLAPFATIGLCSILIMPLYMCTLPDDSVDQNEEDFFAVLHLLKVPQVVVILITITVSSLMWVALDPILEPNLRQFGLRPFESSLAFVLLSGCYAITSPIAGLIADRMVNTTLFISCGFAIVTIGFLLLGPSPLLYLQTYNHLWLNLVALAIVGIGAAIALVPTYSKIILFSEKAGLSIQTHGMVSGIWVSFYTLGEFIGPVYSGATIDVLGFAWTITIVAILTLLMCLITMLLYFHEKRNTLQLLGQRLI